MPSLDRRLHAFRPDLADRRLESQVNAGRFIDGRLARVAVGVLDLKRAPDPAAGLDTQLLLGAAVRIFDEVGGWAWVQAEADGYVGYCHAASLGETLPASHRVIAPRTFLYPGPDMKLPRAGECSMGAAFAVEEWAETRGTRYARLASGQWAVAQHLAKAGEGAGDFVDIAERLLGTPYLWGGASGFGIDCSGLVQLSLAMTGQGVLRDTDMQAATIGEPVEPGELRRGDLVFWPGHVGIMRDRDTLIHANGHTMDVALEPLTVAVARIGYLYGEPSAYRRPQ
ncbi:MAG: peptidase P60 [Mesorhizobium amorphae]|nr:MAG: peptidase P60 [Mesorhizobium amorphae]